MTVRSRTEPVTLSWIIRRFEQNAIVTQQTASSDEASWPPTTPSMMLSESVKPSGSADKKLSRWTLDKNVTYKTSSIAGVISEEKGVTFEVSYDNCNADATVMEQIISNFIADDVDLMIGVATPVAMRMQALTEDNEIPVVFSAVSDPVGAELVESLYKPGANVTGTSDYLDADAIMNLIFANDPDAKKIGLLYDVGQDSSAASIEAAKKYLTDKGIEIVEHTGSTADEVMLAAEAMVADGVDAVFTPTDNSIMKAELAIYETLAKAGIPHYAGADSFALNGAFLGYGVDYANLGVETANMVADILINGADPATLAVKTFDNGTATINTEICTELGYDYDTVAAAFEPYCTKINTITTAESFSDVQQ